MKRRNRKFKLKGDETRTEVEKAKVRFRVLYKLLSLNDDRMRQERADFMIIKKELKNIRKELMKYAKQKNK